MCNVINVSIVTNFTQIILILNKIFSLDSLSCFKVYLLQILI